MAHIGAFHSNTCLFYFHSLVSLLFSVLIVSCAERPSFTPPFVFPFFSALPPHFLFFFSSNSFDIFGCRSDYHYCAINHISRASAPSNTISLVWQLLSLKKCQKQQVPYIKKSKWKGMENWTTTIWTEWVQSRWKFWSSRKNKPERIREHLSSWSVLQDFGYSGHFKQMKCMWVIVAVGKVNGSGSTGHPKLF